MQTIQCTDAQHGATIRDLVRVGIIQPVFVVDNQGNPVAKCDSHWTAVVWMQEVGKDFYHNHQIKAQEDLEYERAAEELINDPEFHLPI